MILVDLYAPRPCSYGEAVRALCDQRDRYIAQSAATKNGKVAPLPPVQNWTDALLNKREEKC